MARGACASWSADRDEFLVRALLAQVSKGKRSDSGFKKEAWSEVTTAFNERFRTTYHTSKIKSRLDCVSYMIVDGTNNDQLKRDYKDAKYLRENSGFGWNQSLQLPTAPDEVWASIIKDESSDESTPPPKKKCQQLRKRDKRSAGAVIGDAISKLVEVEASKVKNNSDPHERVTLAIDCLMENYSHLDGMNIANLADMMSEGLNATIFMALRGPARDAWIAKKCT
ncbi:unnamed protein product [Aphanomyces euteiches]